MLGFIARALETAIVDRLCLGQVMIRKIDGGGFVLTHRDDESRGDLQTFPAADEALEIAKYDDAGNYRPLKTAPNLRRGWRLQLDDLLELARALDGFYPGRAAAFATWRAGRLVTTPLRDALNRQTGMYRVAAKISDSQIDEVVGRFCRSEDGCLRTILWKRDKAGTVPSKRLPAEKFDPVQDQAALANSSGKRTDSIPLLCQEACNLLVGECRKAIKADVAS